MQANKVQHPYELTRRQLEDRDPTVQKQRRLDQLYMDIAFRVADESHDYRRRVGAVLVKDGSILSYGWNGMPSGHDNHCTEFKLRREANGVLHFAGESKRMVTHAEMNLLAKLTRSGLSAEGATVYCTDMCCGHCSPFLVSARIKEFVYAKPYNKTEGIQELHKHGILVRSMDGVQGTECFV